MKFSRRLDFFKHMAEAQRYSLCHNMALQVLLPLPLPLPQHGPPVMRVKHAVALTKAHDCILKLAKAL
jgi:hypothetical protein